MSALEIFSFSFNAVAPMLLLIAAGYILKSVKFANEDFFKTGNRICFRLALPALLFKNVYDIESLSDLDLSAMLYSALMTLFLFLLGYIVTLFVKDRRQKGVLWQCTFRSNFALIGLVLAEAIGGSEGLQLAAVLTASTIPLFNILAVIALSVFIPGKDGKKMSIGSILLGIVKNPLIIAVFSGFVVLFIRPHVSFSIESDIPFLYDAIEMLAELASPLALIVLGGQFSFSAVKGLKKQIIAGTVLRTMVVPVIGLGCAWLLDYLGVFTLTPAHYAAYTALFGSPIAISSGVMASEMGNDEILAGQLIVWTSIVSMGTVFLIISALKALGLI